MVTAISDGNYAVMAILTNWEETFEIVAGRGRFNLLPFFSIYANILSLCCIYIY